MKDKSYCYVLKKPSSNIIKIGRSTNPISRVNSLSASCDEPLFCLALYDEKNVKESYLHDKFFKYRRNGEWFDYVEDIHNFVHGEGKEYNVVDEFFKEDRDARTWVYNQGLKNRVHNYEAKIMSLENKLKVKEMQLADKDDEIQKQRWDYRRLETDFNKMLEGELPKTYQIKAKKELIECIKEVSQEMDDFLATNELDDPLANTLLRNSVKNLWMSLTKNLARYTYYGLDSSDSVMTLCKMYRKYG